MPPAGFEPAIPARERPLGSARTCIRYIKIHKYTNTDLRRTCVHKDKNTDTYVSTYIYIYTYKGMYMAALVHTCIRRLNEQFC